jgi:hypothetical protein
MGILKEALLPHFPQQTVYFPTEYCKFDRKADGKGKAIFPTRQDAEGHAAYNVSQYGIQHAYHCVRGGGDHWHLTGIVQDAYVPAKPGLAPGGSILLPPKEAEVARVPVVTAPVEKVPDPEREEPEAKEPKKEPPLELSMWTKGGKVVVALRRHKGTQTVQQIATSCGVTESLVYSVAKRFNLTYLHVPRGKRKSKHPQVETIAAPATETGSLATRWNKVSREERALAKLQAVLVDKRESVARQKHELEREEYIMKQPAIDLIKDGATIRVGGVTHKLGMEQCRVLLEQTTKLNRYLK